jgi:hypothetical protein
MLVSVYIPARNRAVTVRSTAANRKPDPATAPGRKSVSWKQDREVSVGND